MSLSPADVDAYHTSLGVHGGKLDSESVAFTLGFLAGMEAQRKRSSSIAGRTKVPTVEELRKPPPQDILFLDMDDTLYSNDWQVAEVISQNIRGYCTGVMNLPLPAARELYLKYGTTLRGMLIEGMDIDLEDYMVKAHDIESVKHLITPDPPMTDMLTRCKVPLWIYTASTVQHVHDVLARLEIRHLFQDRIIACTSHEMGFGSKYEAATYDLARAAAGWTGMGPSANGPGYGLPNPENCYFADDSWKNIERAKKQGWHTCLIGHTSRSGDSATNFKWADHVVHSVHELQDVWPHLFHPKTRTQ